jgi:hypothetical protein
VQLVPTQKRHAVRCAATDGAGASLRCAMQRLLSIVPDLPDQSDSRVSDALYATRPRATHTAPRTRAVQH